ncbi:carboxypeptidase family protein [Marinihelvus fidelis]|uniref:Carboxypeptidase family protein n=1 Tax=Marinihelvus fidelis TaxID=2613842 RepID=A0A5N0T8I3_9GAMM|nr:M14-type cytosolic carboxypeptidase [Marinihelvus fidelis]KAA9130457.1 carboxypeptidase family protein [Marinihelvus fidelis]
MHINAHFDSGNIDVQSAENPSDIRLRIRMDEGDEHGQWFFFQLSDVRGEACTISIENAGEMSYPAGFENYRVVASTDLSNWFRIDTAFDGTALSWRHTPETDTTWFAYFAPYTYDRHQRLIGRAQAAPGVRAEVLCPTPDGHAVTLLRFGEPAANKKSCWVIARQHPGESMAEWWAEGFVNRLLDPEDAVARALLERAVVYVVPSMNPDGAVRGHLRCNAHGVNLNRAWKDPDETHSPEVYFTRRRMHETGVDFFMDVHGDEALPYNFVAGGEGVPSWTEAMNQQFQAFKNRLAAITPDFQTTYGYPVSPPASSDLRKATDYVTETFGCLAMTLEMPFKDAANHPVPEIGWSPGRCQRLGASCLDAIWQTLDD